MGARTGAQFLEGLRRTKREIWVDGERIADVTAHPKLRGGAESLAAMFDRQHEFAGECLFADPESGEPTNVSHMIPRSRDDLVRRHAGLVRLSEGSMGIMGRTPDYMNMKFAAFASAPEVWAGADGRNARGARNVVAFQRRLARTTSPSRTRSSSRPSTSGPTRGSSATRSPSARSARPPTASSCAGPGCWRRSRPTPTRRRSIRASRFRRTPRTMPWPSPSRSTRRA